MSATEAQVWDALGRVSDPEYPLSIVDLGMVYGVRTHANTVEIALTFTSIGCPAIDMIVSDIHGAVDSLDGVDDVQVEIVWSPPWTRERITERGRRILAVHGVVS